MTAIHDIPEHPPPTARSSLVVLAAVHFTDTDGTGKLSEPCADGMVQAGARTHVRAIAARGPGLR